MTPEVQGGVQLPVGVGAPGWAMAGVEVKRRRPSQPRLAAAVGCGCGGR